MDNANNSLSMRILPGCAWTKHIWENKTNEQQTKQNHKTKGRKKKNQPKHKPNLKQNTETFRRVKKRMTIF